MNSTQWFLIAYLVLGGLIVVMSGLIGRNRQYTGWDAIWAVPEVAFLIYLITTL